MAKFTKNYTTSEGYIKKYEYTYGNFYKKPFDTPPIEEEKLKEIIIKLNEGVSKKRISKDFNISYYILQRLIAC
jgi:hypothetical protein